PDNQRINWEWIVGDREPPGGIANPRDPLMLEAVEPRVGTNPATGEALAGPDATSPTANSMNGHEWANPQHSSLQYACVFELAEPRGCPTLEEDRQLRAEGLAVPNCECTDTGEPEYADPVCQDSAGEYGYTQYRAPAYPSIRQLQVLRELGSRAS